MDLLRRLPLLAGAAMVLACQGSSSDAADESQGGCRWPGPTGLCICNDTRPSVNEVPECSAETMGGTVVCCSDDDECTCGLYFCNSVMDFCSCNAPGEGSSDSMSCTGAVCCANEGRSCACGTFLQCSGDEQVPSCTIDTIHCAAGKTRVEKCTPL